jgi:DNA-directed RNA polymerase subunit M/transcription elongation factor TFIIS
MARSAVIDQTPLGSLTQAASRSARRCDACGSDRVTELSMTLTDSTPVLFVSCRACEHRSWNAAEGATLPIGQVLERARKIR